MGDDHIQMRDGSALTGTVKNTTFSVKGDLGLVVLRREDLIEIVFQSPTTGPQDRITTKEGDVVLGTVTDPTIEFGSEALGGISIPTSGVLAVQFTFA